MSIIARLEGASKAFEGGILALDGLTLSIPEGGFVSLLGPSGCGKSTALRLLAGLEAPSAGRREWPGGKPQMGFVFQDATLMPWASVFDNVALPLRLLRRPMAADEIAAALERVGLAAFARAMPRSLSGGMRMRASLARALITRPQLLLLDEPFAALDELTREDLNDALLALHTAQRFSAVFVTHSVGESVYLSNRIIVMSPRPGRVIASFTNDDPLPRPRGYRSSAGFAARCGEISFALRAGMKEAVA
ncbi:MAG: ABC transporter ATP-binding protein [Alphaproteobacteria bacterium]|nr:ABC transporter ATP-binding protein [Alphaproteobacteria bacterium]